VQVRFAEYTPELIEGTDGRKKKHRVWHRHPRTPETFQVPLDAKALAAGVPVPDTSGVWVVGQIEPAEAPGLANGVRALSLFLVNKRAPNENTSEQDTEFLFQAELSVSYSA